MMAVLQRAYERSVVWTHPAPTQMAGVYRVSFLNYKQNESLSKSFIKNIPMRKKFPHQLREESLPEEIANLNSSNRRQNHIVCTI